MQDPQSPPLGPEVPLAKLIGAARRQIRQAFWNRFAVHGLTPQQGWILLELSSDGPMSLHTLAQWVFMDDPTACRIVKTLQDRGLVESAPDPSHGRRNIITVSAAGSLLVPGLKALVDDLGREMERGFTESEKQLIRTTLLKLIANLAK